MALRYSLLAMNLDINERGTGAALFMLRAPTWLLMAVGTAVDAD